jgi:hypothetical protein
MEYTIDEAEDLINGDLFDEDLSPVLDDLRSLGALRVDPGVLAPSDS